jgi:protein arginine N-methyltransferase 1
MYSLRDYGNMVGDQRRVAGYVEALRRVVKPGHVVLDIGTGTGVLALTASRLGARRVFAVEPGDVIELAREIAEANGFGSSIEFIHGLTTDIDLPERADVIVSEIHGVLPLFHGSVVTLIDARERLLAPGGAMIPASETIFASVVEAPRLHAGLVAPWGEGTLGFDMRRGRRHVTSDIYRAEFHRDDLLTDPGAWATLDYSRIDGTDVYARLSLRARRAGAAHGLGLWFDSVLAEGVAMTNAPGEAPLVFGNGFFPWPEEVAVGTGDTIDIEISATLLHDRYLWRWNSRVTSGGSERASFRQSQFDAALLVPEKLRRQAATHVPKLNEEGEMERIALARMGEGRPLGEIATALHREFPRRFARWQDALSWVGDLALRCSD